MRYPPEISFVVMLTEKWFNNLKSCNYILKTHNSTLIHKIAFFFNSQNFIWCPAYASDLIFSQSFRSSPSSANLKIGKDIQLVEAKYSALLFKQQLTAYMEKMYGVIWDNLKKDLSPLLSSCIQVNWPWFYIYESCHDVFNEFFFLPISRWASPLHFFNDLKSSIIYAVMFC